MEGEGALRCYTAALRLLQHRWNSEGELRRKLRAREFPPAEIDQALLRLRTEGLVDDRRFAGAYVRMQFQSGKSRARVLHKLAAAGVPEDTARAAVQENHDPEAERSVLLARCRRRLKSMRRAASSDSPSPQDMRKKLCAYLLRQGYESGLVLEVVREVLGESEGNGDMFP